jgi:hypothetical protein
VRVWVGVGVVDESVRKKKHPHPPTYSHPHPIASVYFPIILRTYVWV